MTPCTRSIQLRKVGMKGVEENVALMKELVDIFDRISGAKRKTRTKRREGKEETSATTDIYGEWVQKGNVLNAKQGGEKD